MSNLNWDINLLEHINCKNQLEEIYNDIAEGIKVRSKCQWYEEGEKSTKLFLNLEKTKATQDTVKKLEINNKEINNPVEINKELDNKEINNPVEINKELERLFENSFKRKLRKTLTQEKKKKVCDEEICEQEVILPMKSFSNNTSPGNDDLTKEF